MDSSRIAIGIISGDGRMHPMMGYPDIKVLVM
jgi:hypothetical protein